MRGRPGISLLADRADTLIVPCGIVGTPTARLRLMSKTKVSLNFGRPFRMSELPADVRRDRQATADAIMLRIAETLPSQMRGVYAHGMPKEGLRAPRLRWMEVLLARENGFCFGVKKAVELTEAAAETGKSCLQPRPGRPQPEDQRAAVRSRREGDQGPI
jgi:hypothetical protein